VCGKIESDEHTEGHPRLGWSSLPDRPPAADVPDVRLGKVISPLTLRSIRPRANRGCLHLVGVLAPRGDDDGSRALVRRRPRRET